MPKNANSLSNKRYRNHIKTKNKLEWICETADSYQDAYDQMSKVKHNGTFMYHNVIVKLLTNKKVVKLNPKLRRKK